MRRIIIVIAIVIVVACVAIPLLLGASGFKPGAGGPSGFGNGVTVQTATIDKGNLELTVSATGSVVAKNQSVLKFDQPAQVQEVLVQEGQKVEAGQILARLDSTTQQFNLQQAEFALKAAQAGLQKVLLPVDQGVIDEAESNVKAAEAAYSSRAGAVSPDTVKAYEFQYQQAQPAAKAASDNGAGAGCQYANKAPNYQKALAQEGAATFQTETARLRLEQGKAGSSLVSATANIAEAQARLAQVKAGPTQLQIDAAQAQVANAILVRDQAQHQLDTITLKAPYAGIVTSVLMKAGEASNGAAIVITDISERYVDVEVDEADIGLIQTGQHVNLTLDALPGTTLTGAVERIAQIADESASVIKYPVRVALDPNTAPIKIAMTVNAVFIVRDIKNVMRIPNQYLRIDRVTRVATVTRLNTDGTSSEVPVKLGLQGSDYTEVIEGLGEGDTVILSIVAPTRTLG